MIGNDTTLNQRLNDIQLKPTSQSITALNWEIHKKIALTLCDVFCTTNISHVMYNRYRPDLTKGLVLFFFA